MATKQGGTSEQRDEFEVALKRLIIGHLPALGEEDNDTKEFKLRMAQAIKEDKHARLHR